jgi:transcription elongation GreA/GreB family factor
VKILCLDTNVKTEYIIVGTTEADILVTPPKISNESPV